MKKCAVCHEPVVPGVVVHSECMALLQKAQQLDDKPLTNGDRIRAMSDEELSVYLANIFCHGYGADKIGDWITQPAEVE